MRGSVGSNVNRRKLTAKYSKKTTSTPAKDIVVSTSNKSLTTSTVPTRGQQRATSQSIAKEQPVRKIVPASTEVSSQGIVMPAIGKSKQDDKLTQEQKRELVSRDLSDAVIAKDSETGRWDHKTQLAGWTAGQKTLYGFGLGYEQPLQLGKNILEGVTPENQMVKDTGVDLALNPLMETLAAAKDDGLTQRDFYWPDQFTGIDHPSVPDFLRTGGGSGSDIIGGLANNLGYIKDVISSDKTYPLISQRYAESGERFMEEPGMYTASIIGEIPLWLIGVGEAKAVYSVSSKAAITAIKVTAATGKMPSPGAIKNIVQKEMINNKLAKNIEKSKRLENQNKKTFIPKGLTQAVGSAIKLVKDDLDLPMKKRIKENVEIKKAEIQKQIKIKDELIELSKAKKNTLKPAIIFAIKEKMKQKRLEYKTSQHKFAKADKFIISAPKRMDGTLLSNQFKKLKSDKSRKGQERLLLFAKNKIHVRMEKLVSELPNQVNVIKANKLKHIDDEIGVIDAKASKFGNKNPNKAWWDERGTKLDHLYEEKFTEYEMDKLIRMKNKRFDLVSEKQKVIEIGDDWKPWGETIRFIDRQPGNIKTKVKNVFDTSYTNVGDGLLPVKERTYSGWGGQLQKFADYHLENIANVRQREVKHFVDMISDKTVDVGLISSKEIKAIRANAENEKLGLLKELNKPGGKESQLTKLNIKIDRVEEMRPSKNNRKALVSLKHKRNILVKDIKKTKVFLDDMTNWIVTDLTGAMPSKGIGSDVYRFEPKFLKSFMGEKVKELYPEEILYTKRPVVTGRKRGDVISVTSGTGESDSGITQWIFSRKPKAPIKNKAKRVASKFKPKMPPGMRIQDRTMTEYNTSAMWGSQKTSPGAETVFRLPKNMRENEDKFIQSAYLRKLNPETDKKEIGNLSQLAGSENYNYYVTRPYPVSSKQFDTLDPTDPENWNKTIINVGKSVRTPGTKDTEINLFRSFDEIEQTRAYLSGDTEYNLNQRLINISSNIEKQNIELGALNVRRASDKIPLSKSEQERHVFLGKQIEEGRIERGKVEHTLDSYPDLMESYARQGIGFGVRRGTIGTTDNPVAIFGQPDINKTTAFTSRRTGKHYMTAMVNDKIKVYELSKLELYHKVRSKDELPSTGYHETAVGHQGGSIKNITIKELEGVPDSLTEFEGKFHSKGTKARTTENIQQDDWIILDPKPTKDAQGNVVDHVAMNANRGVREIGTKELNELRGQPTFAKQVSDLQEFIIKKDIKPDKQTVNKDGNIVNTKSLKKQVDDFMKLSTADNLSKIFGGASEKIENIKNILKEDEMIPYVPQIPKDISKETFGARGSSRNFVLGTDSLSPLQARMSETGEAGTWTNRTGIEGKTETAGTPFMPRSVDDAMTGTITGDVKIFNIVDMAVMGGRNHESPMLNVVKDAIKDQQYNRYLATDGIKSPYDELLFAAKQDGSEESFRTNLVIAYEKQQGTVKTEAGTINITKSSKEHIDKQIKQKIVYITNKDTGFKEFNENNTHYIAMINDIRENNMLREVTKKERLSLRNQLGKRKINKNTSGKKIEQLLGVISIKHNFGNLSELLPNHSLVGRLKKRTVGKFSGVNTFGADIDNLTDGAFTKTKHKIQERLGIQVQEDPDFTIALGNTLKKMDKHKIKVDPELRQWYDTRAGRVDARQTSITNVQKSKNDDGLNIFDVSADGRPGIEVKGKLTDADKEVISSLGKQLDILEQRPYFSVRFSGKKKFDKGEKSKTVKRAKENQEIYEAIRDLNIRVTVKDKQGKRQNVNVTDKRVSSDQYLQRINQRKIEIALQKSNVEKDYIDPSDYTGMSQKLEELNFDNVVVKQWIGDDEMTAVERAAIQELKRKQGKPIGADLSPEHIKAAGSPDVDEYFTISSKNQPIISTNNLSGKGIGQEALKVLQKKGLLDRAPGFKNRTVWDDELRIKAFDSILKKFEDRSQNKQPRQSARPVDDDISYEDDIFHKLQTTHNVRGRDEHAAYMLSEAGFKVDGPGFSYNHLNKLTRGDETTYHYALPFKKSGTYNIKNSDDWFHAPDAIKKKVYEEKEYKVESVQAAPEFKYNRSSLSHDIGTSPVVKERLTWSATSGGKKKLQEFSEWKREMKKYKESGKSDPELEKRLNKQKEQLDKDIKPYHDNKRPRVDYSGIGETWGKDYGDWMYNSSDKKMYKYTRDESGLKTPIGDPIEYEDYLLAYPDYVKPTRSDVSPDMINPLKTKTSKIEQMEKAILKSQGVDLKNYDSIEKQLGWKTKITKSQKIISTNKSLLNKKSGRWNTKAMKKKANEAIDRENKKISGYQHQITELQNAQKTQSASSVTRDSTKQFRQGGYTRFFRNLDLSDTAQKISDQQQRTSTSYKPGSVFSIPVGTNITPGTQQTKIESQQSIGDYKGNIFLGVASGAEASLKTQQPKIDTSGVTSITSITSGLDLSLPGLITSVSKTGAQFKPAQSSRLDANLGWLAAQLPDQITKPLTRMDSMTSVVSAMKVGTALRTSSLLKLEQSFRLKLAMKPPMTGTVVEKKFQPTDFIATTQRSRTASIMPIAFGPLPWEAAEERKRKRKKKPKRKAAKTWWQTPENWYESNYWGKSGEGSGYVTFKGSEPKRLKDRKNQFGF